MSKFIQLSRTLSYLLRHNPEELSMDKEGWVYTKQIIDKLEISKDILDAIIKENDKQRFSYNKDESKIRASQGHSEKLKVDIKFRQVQYPSIYYHGTIKANIPSIFKSGIIPGNRSYVHLSKDVETARKVGSRHGNDIVILSINGNEMKRDKLDLYISDNGVILSKHIPAKYIKITDE